MNTQEYLDNVLQLITQTFRPSDPSGSMPVATAAYLIKQRLGVDHTTFGFAKFKDVLNELESRGTIRTGTNTKNAYAIWMTGPVSGPIASGASSLTFTPFRPLRNPVWFAFVSGTPLGKRFLNRVTGEVRIGLQESLSGDWVEIIPMSPTDERATATGFLASHPLATVTEIQQALLSEKWYFEFPLALGKINPQLASDWKRQRSRRVVERVEKWCGENNVELRLVYEQQGSREPERSDQRPQLDLRRVLLLAIERMPTEELLNFQIPPRFLIATIRPELLSN